MTLRKRVMIVCLLLCLTVGAAPALSSNVTPEQMLELLFTSDSIESDWFTPAVLAQVSVEQMAQIIQQYLNALGPYESAQGEAPGFQLIFQGGYANSQIFLDAEGRIAGIWFGLPEPKVSGLEDATSGFEELPGKVSLLVTSDAGVLASIRPELPMAVGSTFKLAILAALKDQVNAGVMAWDDVIELKSDYISLPSGMLQEWPVGSPITLHTLASLMISISDNTATNALLDVVGRERIEAYTMLNHPFLTTREAFILKDPANSSLLGEYRQGDVEQRRSVLEKLEQLELPSPSIFAEPVALDVEWFFSVSELAGLMAYVQDLPMMSINPGIASPASWQHIAYKGGSEPGVLNLTTRLVSSSGANYFVSATWNHDEVLDETKFFSLYSGLLRELEKIDAGE